MTVNKTYHQDITSYKDIPQLNWWKTLLPHFRQNYMWHPSRKTSFRSIPPFASEFIYPGGSDDKSSGLQCGRPRIWSLGWEDLLEKEMATHSSTLAWKMPWTEKPGRLQSMGSQRVRHDWATSLSLIFNWQGFPGDSVVKNPPTKQETWVWSLDQEDPLKEMVTDSSILA